MHSATIFAILAGASSAFPMPMKTEAVEGYEWDVINWSAACTMDVCHYDFNITGVATDLRPARPAFSASCSGDGEGSPYRDCELLDSANVTRRVAAKLLPVNETGTRANIQVSFKYIDLQSTSTWWNFTGHAVAPYTQSCSPALNYTMKPNTIIGVA